MAKGITGYRGIKPSTPILFWNRLWNTKAPVTVDFGYGTEKRFIVDELVHSYQRAGLYTVTFTSKGPEEEPVTVKMKVVVEDTL